MAAGNLYKMLSIQEATDTVLQSMAPLGSRSLQDISAANGYVLAQDILAREPLPPFPASIKVLNIMTTRQEGFLD